jgi:hypothetical protein
MMDIPQHEPRNFLFPQSPSHCGSLKVYPIDPATLGTRGNQSAEFARMIAAGKFVKRSWSQVRHF